MKKLNRFLVVSSVGALLMAQSAFASITMPTIDYTDLESAAGVAIGVAAVVMLARKAIQFFR